jgi:hypothetical protein
LYMFNGGVLKEIANQIEELKEHGKWKNLLVKI